MVYSLQGNSIKIPVKAELEGHVGNLTFDNELGQRVLVAHNDRFRSISRIEDLNPYKEGQSVSFSNVPIALSYAQIIGQLAEEAPDFAGLRVLRLRDKVKYWHYIPDKGTTYADTSEVAIFPNEGPNEELRRQALEDILKIRKTSEPLIVSGLVPVPSSNIPCGFEFDKEKSKPVVDEDYSYLLRKDGFVRYNPETEKIELCKEGDEDSIRLYVPDFQSGLRRLYRDRDELYSRGGYLLGSDGIGRVQLVQEPKALAKNFEALLNAHFAEMQERFRKASEYLRTGKL